MISIKKIDPNKADARIVNEVIRFLQAGGIIIYPTDTCYGIGGIYDDQKVIEAITTIKGRDPEKKNSIFIPSIDWALKNFSITSWQEEVLRSHLPGDFTFVVDNEKQVGIRIPKAPFMQFLVGKLGQPITATSANISGEENPYSLNDLQKGILRQPRLFNYSLLVLDASKLPKGKISTVVDLTKNPAVIIRQGSGNFNN